MPHPEDPYEDVSRELNEVRERRLSDRRFKPRGTADRRVSSSPAPQETEAPDVPSIELPNPGNLH